MTETVEFTENLVKFFSTEKLKVCEITLLLIHYATMIIIEGNIGAGKSTFLSALANYAPHIYPITEPVDAWNSNQHSLLAQFYADQHRWAFTLEMATLCARIKDHRAVYNLLQDKICVAERSLYSGFYCFARVGFLNGSMSPLEWEIYSDWFNYTATQLCPLPTGFIYLYTTPECAYKRILKRARSAEQQLSLQYVTAIHDTHEQLLIKRAEYLAPSLRTIPVLTLDCTIDFEHSQERTKLLCEQAVEFIMNHEQKNGYISQNNSATTGDGKYSG